MSASSLAKRGIWWREISAWINAFPKKVPNFIFSNKTLSSPLFSLNLIVSLILNFLSYTDEED